MIAEQIRERLKRLQQQPSAQAETAFYANADKDIAYLLTLLDTLSQSLAEAQGEIARLQKENDELLTRSGRPDVERDFSIHASTDKGSSWQPIETAPRDKTAILVHSHTLGLVICVYDEDLPEKRGYTRWQTLWDGATLASAPTHWTPLPPSPEGR